MLIFYPAPKRVRVQYLAKCEYICTVPASTFHPAPSLDSAVVRLIPRQLEKQANDPKYLETLVKLGFSAKWKMLRNNLQSVIERSGVDGNFGTIKYKSSSAG